MEKICWQITVAAFMQPLQYDLRSRAAKDNSITNAATARSNLDTAITMRSAETELQNTIELRTTASEIVAPKPGSRRQSEKKTILKHFLKGFLEGNSLAPKWRKSADKSLWQPSCSHSNTIYEVQLQKTIVLPMQPQQKATLTQPFTLRERSYSCKAQWNSIGNSSTSNTCNPIYIEGTILELQITMEFHRQLIHQHHLQSHLHCGNDPTVTNHNGTAAKDNSITNAATAKSNLDATIYTAGTILQLQSTMEFHRQLIHQQHLQSHLHWGNDPTVAKHNGIPSATHPKAPLAIPFTLRERSYSCKSQWNSVDRTCTKNRWNPIYNAEPIRTWSAHDPTTHETVSQPSHRRGRSSRFGDGLCMEKHRVSCICYLSKTHFVRDFLQNSIGNSSTSTTCNAICIAGTILQLQSTMEFHRQLIHQHHLQSHLHCGNDPTVANHNGILATAHARKTGETPFTMRNRSDHDPNMIRPWSDHTRDRLATVAPQR